jgi:transposase
MSHHLQVQLTDADRKELEKIVRTGKNKARVITRARVLLMADRKRDKHKTQPEIAASLGISNTTVSATSRRYMLNGLTAALSEKPRPGQTPKITGDVEAQMVTLACSEPPEGYARWTLRLLRDELVRLEVVDSLSHVAVGEALKKTKLNLGR